MINVAEEMKHLHKLAKCDPAKRFNHLWENLVSPEWLAQAWEQIRRNKGSQTAGIDNQTAVDIDLSRIIKLAEKLRTGTYRPKVVRRVHIPKANGKTRPLGISTIEDRIVQQALRMLLEPIFEADFLDCSHGFRQSRSTHTALRDVVRGFPVITWIIEGDIEGCYDNIQHGKLIEQLSRRLTDEKVLRLIWRFLKAGYLEDWRYHKTYSGVPQGNILGPLLANVFLHQLDEFMIKELAANRTQTRAESDARRNPEYRRLNSRIRRSRKKLPELDTQELREAIKEIRKLERQQRKTPSYAKDRKHPCKVKYVRYADDTLVMVAGNKQEAEAIKEKIKAKLSEMGLRLSEEKTKITHWSHTVRFLGYDLQGKLRDKGNGIRAILKIPFEKLQAVKKDIQEVCGYYQIPEADVMTQVSAIFRGWCNYYRYANSPQPTFNRLAYQTWQYYAHYLARKQKSSMAKMIRREQKAGRLGAVQKNGRNRITFQLTIGKRRIILDTFPPKTGQIRLVSNQNEWKVDLKPVTPMNWQSGRSLATRLEAVERAGGICEECKTNPVEQVHHTVPIRQRSFLARVMSDESQRYTARALCKECHLKMHGGSFNPKKRQKSNRNAGYIERCSSSVGSAG
jgi:group II intron reverse transcriptase/maturase